jgi:phage terminase large subunit-like protein
MNKVKTMQEAYRVFELLGIKEVTKKWQKKQGTEVWELPQKTMYYNGSTETNRFSIYKSGYIRKMVVHPTSNASYSCYQLNRTRKCDEYVKDYEWCKDKDNLVWTGKYRKSNRTKRIMIDTHQERVVYLCNYILKNYYRNGKMNLVGEYTMKRVSEVHGEWWRANRNSYDLPFEETVERDSWIDDNDVKVIINGHRYNLS